MSSDYSEKLKDPRWQQKRLRIFERDQWQCQICASTTSTLHVHHIAYDPDASGPWDADDAVLMTLCEGCHETESAVSKALRYTLFTALSHAHIRCAIDLLFIIEDAYANEQGSMAVSLGDAIRNWPEKRRQLILSGDYSRRSKQ